MRPDRRKDISGRCKSGPTAEYAFRDSSRGDCFKLSEKVQAQKSRLRESAVRTISALPPMKEGVEPEAPGIDSDYMRRKEDAKFEKAFAVAGL